MDYPKFYKDREGERFVKMLSANEGRMITAYRLDSGDFKIAYQSTETYLNHSLNEGLSVQFSPCHSKAYESKFGKVLNGIKRMILDDNKIAVS